MSYAKLFSSILDSTVWAESLETKVLWITMLAMKDYRGHVEASVPGLAKRAGISLKECQAGLRKLMAPDEHSRTKEFEGRRISEIDGGWLVLNHKKYREQESRENRRESMRVASAKYREKKKGVEIDRAAIGPKEPRPIDIAPPPEIHNGSFEQWRATHPAGNEVL